MSKNNRKKLNEGCLKIFHFIRLLYEDKAYYKDVLEIFDKDITKDSINNVQVILNKYLNTFKVFGIRVRKDKNKFKLISSFYSLPFSNDDLKAISIIENAVKNFPEEDITQDINTLISMLIMRMTNLDKNNLNKYSQNSDFTFFYTDLKEQIEQCEQLCKENQSIEIHYQKNKETLKIKCNPKEVIYESKNVYLRVYDITKRENIDIPLSNILSIIQHPQIANSIELTTTVVYKLKNRLAKSYRLKDGEEFQGFDANGNQIIVNKNEPIDKLLKRLMRYTSDCEIISPKFLREKMITLINETLQNYEK